MYIKLFHLHYCSPIAAVLEKLGYLSSPIFRAGNRLESGSRPAHTANRRDLIQKAAVWSE